MAAVRGQLRRRVHLVVAKVGFVKVGVGVADAAVLVGGDVVTGLTLVARNPCNAALVVGRLKKQGYAQCL